MNTLMVFTTFSMRIACKQIYLYLMFSSFHGFSHFFLPCADIQGVNWANLEFSMDQEKEKR